MRIRPQLASELDEEQTPTTPARLLGNRTAPLSIGQLPRRRQAAPTGVVDTGEPDAPPDDDLELAEYVARIEQAAARERATGGVRSGVAGTTRVVTSGQDQPGVARLRRRKKVKQKKPFLRRKRTWVIFAVSLPILVGLVGTLYMLNLLRLGIDAYEDIHEDPVERTRWQVNPEGTPVPIPTEQAQLALPNWDGDDPVNIVLLGVDSRDGDENPPRSDTTIVVHVDPRTAQVAMMSIPRDLQVFIPGYGEDKFNAAYPLGEVNADEIPGGGTTLVAQTIEANFDIRIHYYMTVDFEGFKKIVDTVGGVIVDNNVQLSDNLYPTDDQRLTRVYFPTGPQKLDGERALQYVRTRHADSDLGRAERQQQLLLALRQQAIDLNLITRADQLIQDLRDTIRTDLDFNQMLALANLGRRVENQSIAKFNLWEEGLLTEHYPEFEGDAYLLLGDWEAIRRQKAELFGGPPSESAQDSDEGTAAEEEQEGPEPNFDTPIFVENGTTVPQLAGAHAQILVDAGFTAVWPGNAEQPVESSAIHVYNGDLDTARFIADQLGLPHSAITTDEGNEGITVVLGEDAIPDEDPQATEPAEDEGTGG